MVGPIYVPVLPMRRDAWNAYAQLDLRIRRGIAPLWTVVPHSGRERTRGVTSAPDWHSDQSALDRWLTPRTEQLIEVMDGMPGWVDATHVEAGIHGSAPSLWRLVTRSRLRLVTGPERDPALQRYAADLALLSGRGIGIRLLIDDHPPDELRSTELLSLIDRLCLTPSSVDLILDIGAVADPAEAGKTAITSLDVLGTLAPWRTVVLTSGAFPRAHDSPDPEPSYVARRHDRQLYQSVRSARPAFPRALVYGDYSVEHALSANVPHVRASGPPWGVMRYTAPDGFLIGRVPTRGSDHVDRVRAMARWITESDAFRGPEHSDGEHWLHECARGEGAKGSGNAETWIKVGHVQHMTYVVNTLQGGN